MQGIVLQVHLPDHQEFLEQESVKELESLIKTAKYFSYQTIYVRSSQIFVGTYMSLPVAQKLVETFESLEKEHDIKIDTIFLNAEISPSQLFQLEKIWSRVVIDRVELILRIFQLNARTLTAKVQVEMAQLEYSLPRLKRMWKHLSRIEGGIGFSKGQGEKQIEIDKRLIQRRMVLLKKKLKNIEGIEANKRKKRGENSLLSCSLVGYTNAGKTTLINRLAKENLYAQDQLFATLSPVTRRVYLKDQRFALISDTVGFISQLPHFLIESFKATLEETVLSDVLLILQDATSPIIEEQLNVVKTILKKLNIQEKPQRLIFTKIDLLSQQKLEQLKILYSEAIFISSKNQEGLEILIETLCFLVDEKNHNF